jgi:5,10-methylene-tetrahydrofolate dehydrogenase/methenyl tetrahydrofolate cyclohydrolase
MTRVICHADTENLPSVRKAADVHVVLYGKGAMPLGVARIGSMLMDPISRLKLGIRTDAG